MDSADTAYVELDAARFREEIDGVPVGLYTIRNARGMFARITNFGARVEQIVVPDRDGRMGDVVQGYETIGQVIAGQPSMGAFIGRYANRIRDGRFELDGVVHQLTVNDVSADPAAPRRNTLHGGTRGSRFLPFAAVQRSPQAVQMSLRFRAGEEGFPGGLLLRVTYTATENDELAIAYDAYALDCRTVANFTSHIFFNLSGDLGSTIEETLLTVAADDVLEIDSTLTPTGKLRPVADTPMDFRQAKAIGRDIGADYDLLRPGGGYDAHYVVDPAAAGELKLHARAQDPRSGRVLEVRSTEPGIQFYSGNFLQGIAPRDVGKGGTVYGHRSAFCLEPSHFPDSVNHPQFPSTVLEAGGRYHGEIRYRFLADRLA
jgi:aldose 1-epimerase